MTQCFVLKHLCKLSIWQSAMNTSINMSYSIHWFSSLYYGILVNDWLYDGTLLCRTKNLAIFGHTYNSYAFDELKTMQTYYFYRQTKACSPIPWTMSVQRPSDRFGFRFTPYYFFFLSKIQDKTPSTLKYVFYSVLFSIDFFIFTHIAGNLMLNPTS